MKPKTQASKRARDARQKAAVLDLPRWVGHPSHVTGRRLRYHPSRKQVAEWWRACQEETP